MCLPRPDSPSLFGSLLDRSAGFFRFGPSNSTVPDQRRYLPGTMVLETTWHTPTGWMTVEDLLVVGPAESDERLERYRRVPGDSFPQGTLLRIATCYSGRVEVQIDCLPLFDYGLNAGEWSYDGSGYERLHLTHGDLSLTMASSIRLGTGGCARVRAHDAARRRVGVRRALVGRSSLRRRMEEASERTRDQTRSFWRDWLSTATFPDHRWRPYIERSALALKGLSYAPTGAIMAASTTSLPETPGGERNWDYRYTWIRDTAFMLRALHGLGFDWEAFEYFAFILDALRGCSRQAGTQPTASTSRSCTASAARPTSPSTRSTTSPGIADSRPVRIGNGAYNQRQHDVWGMLLDAVGAHVRNGGQMAPQVWEGIAGLVDTAIADEPRTRPGHLGDARQAAALRRVEGDVLGRRRAWRPSRRHRVATPSASRSGRRPPTGCTPRSARRASTSAASSRSTTAPTALDASLLLIPIMGFLPPDDERVRATVLAIADELTKDGLVLRYKVESTDDGLSGEEGTFTICSFWLVSALAIIGEIERARALFEKLLSFAGPLLLYAEEIDVTTGQHLGNYPAGVHAPRAHRRRQPPDRRGTDRRSEPHRVVVVGGGFGGPARVPIPRARQRGRGDPARPAEPPSLPTTALPGRDRHPAARPDRAGAAARAAQGRNVTVELAEVTGFDLDRRVVHARPRSRRADRGALRQPDRGRRRRSVVLRARRVRASSLRA